MFGVAIPGLTKQTGRLVKGQTLVLEFTPQKKGTYPLVCTSMGMRHGASITIL
jgi:heme/copper-type cytochrome/quinol oxidase subunit 2